VDDRIEGFLEVDPLAQAVGADEDRFSAWASARTRCSRAAGGKSPVTASIATLFGRALRNSWARYSAVGMNRQKTMGETHL